MNTRSKVQEMVSHSKVLVFDVETTGLLPQKPRNSTQQIPLSDYPHIIQLSFAVYDLNANRLVRTYDSYVKIDADIEISEYVSKLTGITRDICNNSGNGITDVLKEFYMAYMECNAIVAHNMDFDEKMILIEFERYREQLIPLVSDYTTLFNKAHEQKCGIERYCTMRKGIALCNIMVESKIPGKPPKAKWPKLAELYAKLFDGETVDGMHNSMVDVMACLRCYLKMRHGHHMEK
jgi:DNA polymerase III epsilon subunit-like protein